MKLLIILANIAALKALNICNDLPTSSELSTTSTSELPSTSSVDSSPTSTSDLLTSATTDQAVSSASSSSSSSSIPSFIIGQEERQDHRKSNVHNDHESTKYLNLHFMKEKLLNYSAHQNAKYSVKRDNNEYECPCGISNEAVRIQNGVSVFPEHKYPWMALIRTYKKNRYFICGGSIISKHYILTAAHCFTEYESVVNPSKVKVTVGDFSRSSEDDIEGVTKTHEVEEILINPNFSLYNKLHDIALVRLKLPIDLSSHKEIRSICLPEDYTYYNEVVTYAGWGIQDQEFKTSAKELQEGSGPSEDPCIIKYWDKDYWHSQFCLKGYVQDSFLCQGDSGGPVMRVHKGRYEIIGIVSNGISYYGEISLCSVPDGQMNVMKVSYYLGWIHENIDSNC